MPYHHVILRHLTKLCCTWIGWFAALAWTELPVKGLSTNHLLCVCSSTLMAHTLCCWWFGYRWRWLDSRLRSAEAMRTSISLYYKACSTYQDFEVEEVALKSGTWKAFDNCTPHVAWTRPKGSDFNQQTLRSCSPSYVGLARSRAWTTGHSLLKQWVCVDAALPCVP